jgi:hypothetical protein
VAKDETYYLLSEGDIRRITNLQAAAQLLSVGLPPTYTTTPKGNLRALQTDVGNLLLRLRPTTLVAVGTRAMFACDDAAGVLVKHDEPDAARAILGMRTEIGSALPPLPE